MFESRSQIESVLSRYIEMLRAQGVEVERLYLYGSHVTGTANEWSDVDVVVVSPDFDGKEAWERARVTGAARSETFRVTGASVEGLPKTPEEVAHRHPASFLAHILKNAICICGSTQPDDAKDLRLIPAGPS